MGIEEERDRVRRWFASYNIVAAVHAVKPTVKEHIHRHVVAVLDEMTKGVAKITAEAGTDCKWHVQCPSPKYARSLKKRILNHWQDLFVVNRSLHNLELIVVNPDGKMYVTVTYANPKYQQMANTICDTDNIYAGACGKGSTRSIIFATKRQLRRLAQANQIFSDGTFKPVPKGIGAAQIWNICINRDNNVIPLVRVLMQSRSANAYLEAIMKVMELAPQMNPNEIMCDFEDAQHIAWGAAFPDAERHGCFFHYSKAVGLNAAKLGMKAKMNASRRLHKLVRMLATLALLPTQHIMDGIDVITETAAQWEKVDDIQPLLQYWQRTWPRRIDHLSVSGCKDRTTNICESDNRMLQDDVKTKHPNVWLFLDGIIENESEAQTACKALDNGYEPRAKRRLSAISADARIQCLTRQLLHKELTVEQFLHSACQKADAGVRAGLGYKRKRRTH